MNRARHIISWRRVQVGLLVVGLGCLFSALMMPTICYAPERAKVARAKSDQRALAVALEAYYVDHKAFPPLQPIAGYPRQYGSPFPALTTPVAYLPATLNEVYAPGTPLALYCDGAGYMVVSPGPDKRINIRHPEELYRGGDFDGSIMRLVSGGWTYDPSNGTASVGDVWRVREE